MLGGNDWIQPVCTKCWYDSWNCTCGKFPLHLFPWAVTILDLGASIVYLLQREYRLAFIWFCYACATMGLAGLK